MADNSCPIIGAAKCAAQSVAEILAEIFTSNAPLAKGYRAHFASKSNAEKGGIAL